MLWFLQGRVIRVLEVKLESAQKRELEARESADKMEIELRIWRERCQSAEKRVEFLTDKCLNAGDAVAVRLMGRRMFGNQPTEAPPATHSPSINLSTGANKGFARDRVRRKTAEFFENEAKRTGVVPEESTPKSN